MNRPSRVTMLGLLGVLDVQGEVERHAEYLHPRLANLEVGLLYTSYFRLGNIEELSSRLVEITKNRYSSSLRQGLRDWVASRYDWDKVAIDTLNALHKIN
ncbi:MAG: hypothetical protein Q7U33_00825 [Methylotenera sp.]|uniref:hypothetical protein n=1 Tax=Methylotenera sp. TaxID=2051956 RepID=UPI00271BF170|nr:hypothetical protein [Methylotenera sp.]MDO9149902.1 hypothetical protein [Methylotenera sp.]